jgi:AraC-like DNA-binding protein
LLHNSRKGSKGGARMAGKLQTDNKINRLFLKILSYFLSLLLPILIIGSATYLYSVRVMKHDFNERISANLSTAVHTVDQDLQMAQETGFNFFHDDIVQRLLIPRDKQTLDVKAEQWRLLRVIQRSDNMISDFTDQMFIYVDHRNVYVSGGINEFDSFFTNMYRYDRYDASFWAKELTLSKYIDVLPAAAVGKDGLHGKQVVPIVVMDRVQNQNAAMVLNISVDAIARTLMGNAVFDVTRFVVLDQERRPIFDGGGNAANEGLSVLLAKQAGEDAGVAEIEFQGKRFEVSHVKSQLYGWDYYSLTPYGEFSRHTSGILLMTLLLCVVLIVMGVAFSFIFTFRLYNPIRNIRDIILDSSDRRNADKSGVAASANEFEQIRQGINRLKDDHLEYKVKYDKHTNEYVEYSLLYLLKGHTVNQEEIFLETLAADFGFNRRGFVCCSVLFDFKDAFYQHIQDTDRVYVLNGIKKIIWSLLGAQAPSYVLEYRQNLYVGVVNIAREEETKLLRQAFHHMLQVFQYDIHLYYDITIGIGKFHTSINKVGVSYNEAMTAISNRNGDKRFQIVDSNELSIENRFLYSFIDEQKVLNHLKLGDSAGLQAVIRNIVDTNVERSISYDHIRQLFKEMYMTVIRFAADKGVDARQLQTGHPVDLFGDAARNEAFVGLKEMERDFNEFCRKVMEASKAGGGMKSGNLVTLIEKYVQENYTRDVGLEQIAAEMGVSFKYVSRVFKDKMGMNLTDYINQVRMAKAKELLQNTDLRVNDIAERVGIPSRTTFLRVFKKVEGIAPNEYRSLHRH